MKIIKVDGWTLYFLFICFLCGYIKVALMIFIIVVIHELGHLFFIKLLRYKVLEVKIYPFGGITKVDKDINTPIGHELLIALGGVLAQVVLYGVMFSEMSYLDKELFWKYNTSILLFNMLPIIPLDGSKILECVLNRMWSFKVSYKVNLVVSLISLVLFVGFNYKYSLNNYMVVVFLVFKMYKYLMDEKFIYNRFLLERYLNNYRFRRIDTRKGNLNILKKDVYQYFLEDDRVVSEKKKLAIRFDKRC